MNIRIFLTFILFVISVSSQHAVFADIVPSYQLDSLKQPLICAESGAEENNEETTEEDDDDEPDCD